MVGAIGSKRWLVQSQCSTSLSKRLKHSRVAQPNLWEDRLPCRSRMPTLTPSLIARRDTKDLSVVGSNTWGMTVIRKRVTSITAITMKLLSHKSMCKKETMSLKFSLRSQLLCRSSEPPSPFQKPRHQWTTRWRWRRLTFTATTSSRKSRSKLSKMSTQRRGRSPKMKTHSLLVRVRRWGRPLRRRQRCCQARCKWEVLDIYSECEL